MDSWGGKRPAALIVGVTGMVGVALAEALKKPAARGGPWTVWGASRRAPPPWFPSAALDGFIQFDALDRGDTHRKLSPVAGRVTHLFWVALQALDTEADNIAANSAMLSNVLDALTVAGGLRHVALQTGTKHYMGPIFDPGHAGWLAAGDPPFREDAPRLPYPNFYYALEDILTANSHRLTWSVHRASIILGASSRSVYNLLLTLAAYAEICRYEHAPFRFPGTRYGWEHFCDASDAGLLAEQQIWAATTAAAKNEAFNCTNGDVFTWRRFWRVLAAEMEVEFVPYDEEAAPFDWVEEMKGKGAIWDAIVKENGLVETKLEEMIICFTAADVVLRFGFQHVCCMNKSREHGFRESVDTLKSLHRWIQELRRMNVIPNRGP